MAYASPKLPPMKFRLTEKRKADREAMTREVEALCKEFGATCTVDRDRDPREIRVEIVYGDAQVGLDFDGMSAQLDTYCMPWNIRWAGSGQPRVDAHFTPTFGRMVGADVNPFHGCKCMGFAAGIDSLLHRLRLALRCIQSGEATKQGPIDTPRRAAAA